METRLKPFGSPIVFLLIYLFISNNISAGQNMDSSKVSETILAMERAALDRWGKGDPSGFLEISAPDVCYFDPFMEKRIDNLEGLTKLYESIRGQVKVDTYELVNPRVQVVGDAAVLTFNYEAKAAGKLFKWNCTEVYAKRNGKWQIIQTHWSETQPKK
jgi:hypothetical protein